MKILNINVVKDLDNLTHHPMNTSIYGVDEDTSDLEDLIEKYGQTKNIWINEKGQIISGNRRFIASKKLNLGSLMCDVYQFDSEQEELEMLLLENTHRTKTNYQKAKEAQFWRQIEQEKARNRRGRKKAQSQSSDSNEKGLSRDAIARRVGFGSGENLRKAEKVLEFLENTPDQEIQEMLDKSVHAAYERINELKESEKTDVDVVEVAPLTSKSETTRLEKSPKTFIYVGKNVVWGTAKDGKPISLEARTWVFLLDDMVASNPNQLYVCLQSNLDSSFCVGVTDLDFGGNYLIAGQYRFRDNLKMSPVPITSRTLAQFIACDFLSLEEQKTLSERRIKTINRLIKTEESEKEALLLELESEQKLSIALASLLKRKVNAEVEDVAKEFIEEIEEIEKVEETHENPDRNKILLHSPIKKGDIVTDISNGKIGTATDLQCNIIASHGEAEYVLKVRVLWENGYSSLEPIEFLEKFDPPQKLIDCNSEDQVRFWATALKVDRNVTDQIVALYSRFRELKEERSNLKAVSFD